MIDRFCYKIVLLAKNIIDPLSDVALFPGCLHARVRWPTRWELWYGKLQISGLAYVTHIDHPVYNAFFRMCVYVRACVHMRVVCVCVRVCVYVGLSIISSFSFCVSLHCSAMSVLSIAGHVTGRFRHCNKTPKLTMTTSFHLIHLYTNKWCSRGRQLLSYHCLHKLQNRTLRNSKTNK